MVLAVVARPFGLDVLPIKENLPLLGIVQTSQEGEEGRFPCSRLTDNAVKCPIFELIVHV